MCVFQYWKQLLFATSTTLLFEWDIKNSASHFPGSEATQLGGQRKEVFINKMCPILILILAM